MLLELPAQEQSGGHNLALAVAHDDGNNGAHDVALRVAHHVAHHLAHHLAHHDAG